MTIDSIIERLYRNPLLQNVSTYDALAYLKDFIGLLHITAFQKKKVSTFTIVEFRAKLPEDFQGVHSVRAINNAGTKVRIPSSTEEGIEDLASVGPLMNDTAETYAYKIVPPFIYTDFKEGKVEIIYYGFQLDDKGFPILPDIPSLAIAFENYVKCQYFTMLVELGQINPVALDRAEQQYGFYVGQAERELENFTPDKAESLTNALIRLLPDRDAFRTDFKYNSNKENINLNA